MTDECRGWAVLGMNTFAFTVCFATWMINGVLVTFLVDNDIYAWDRSQMGLLIGIPVLTGALARLPMGMLTDKYGGRIVFGMLLLVSAVPTFLVSSADSYYQFLLAGLGFGLSGASFAVGIAYTSVWFSKERQGTALGIFGAGNAGAALTSMGAPVALAMLTNDGANLDEWRVLPQLYAVVLVITGVLFLLLAPTRRVEQTQEYTIGQRLAPLWNLRVWRFGLYYFLVFGGFVTLAQWLVPYYVSTYTMTVATAGLMAAIFSLPSGVIRALGGWISDKWGARTVMYWVLGLCTTSFLLLIVPRMDIQSPGKGVTSVLNGTVTAVSPSEIVVDQRAYRLNPRDLSALAGRDGEGMLIFPTFSSWQEAVVQVGDEVNRKELLARGVTNIFFQANVWIFTGLVFVAGIAMGIGMAAVYKHIPDYFPDDVGVVGGMVGVLGGLGGFVCPVIFGYLLKATGIWTTSWMFLAILSAISLIWMHFVIQRMMRENAPVVAKQFETMPGHNVELEHIES